MLLFSPVVQQVIGIPNIHRDRVLGSRFSCPATHTQGFVGAVCCVHSRENPLLQLTLIPRGTDGGKSIVGVLCVAPVDWVSFVVAVSVPRCEALVTKKAGVLTNAKLLGVLALLPTMLYLVCTNSIIVAYRILPRLRSSRKFDVLHCRQFFELPPLNERFSSSAGTSEERSRVWSSFICDAGMHAWSMIFAIMPDPYQYSEVVLILIIAPIP